MRINHRLLTAGALAFAITLSSCDNDDEKSSQLSKNDAKTQIATFNNEAAQDLQDLADADGMKAMQDFFGLVSQDDPFGRIATDKNKLRTFLRDKGREFRSVFVPASSSKGKIAGEEAFNFNENAGIYVWNAELGQFEYQSDDETISIIFPTEGSTTNNAKLHIVNYEEQLVEDEFGYVFYEPTLIDADLYVDNVKVAGLDLDINYDTNGFPTAAEIVVAVTPYTATLSFDVSGSTSNTLSFALKQNQETLIATSVVVKYADSSKGEESVNSIEGFVQFKGIKVQGIVDATKVNGDEGDYEEAIDLDLLVNDKKAGDIVFESDEVEGVIPYVKYSDGSMEKLEDVLQPVIDELQALGESLDSNG